MNNSLAEKKLETIPPCAPDKREKPRINCDYPAIIEGIEEDGKKFHEEGRLVNLSASGLYMRLNRSINIWSAVMVTIYLINDLIVKDAPRIITKGSVVRCEQLPDGSYGIAVQFTSYRFT